MVPALANDCCTSDIHLYLSKMDSISNIKNPGFDKKAMRLFVASTSVVVPYLCLTFTDLEKGYSGHDRPNKFEDDCGANGHRKNHFFEFGKMLAGKKRHP